MERRQFLTRSAALVAISSLPFPQAINAIEPKMASGLIEGLDFVIDDTVTLFLDGPIHFRKCTFTVDMTGRRSGISVLLWDDPDDSGGFRVINPNERFRVSFENIMIHAKGGPKAWPEASCGFWIS
jgi:hypothetical protein